jgi:hypothetical protein
MTVPQFRATRGGMQRVVSRDWTGASGLYLGRIQGHREDSRLREPRQKPDSGPANTKRLAARFYQLKTGHCTASPTDTSCGRRSNLQLNAGGVLTGLTSGIISSSSARTGRASRKSCGWRCGGTQGEVRTGLRSGTSSPTSDAAIRSWTPSHYGCGEVGPSPG